MTTIEQVQVLIDRLEQRLVAKIEAMVEFTPITVSSADGTNDQVKVQTEDPARGRPTRRASPWGISGRAIAGDGVLGAIVKAVAGPFNGLMLGIGSDKYGPQDLSPGETCIWNKVNGTRILLDENGGMQIDCAPGQDVVVNGGSAKVSRVGDNLSASAALKTWASQVETGITGGGGTAPSPTFASAVGNAGELGAINEGAPHFLG